MSPRWSCGSTENNSTSGRSTRRWTARPTTPARSISRDPVRSPLAAAFTNDFWDEHHPDPARRDRNLMVNAVPIIGPLDGPPPPKPASHRRIYGRPPGRRGRSDLRPAGPRSASPAGPSAARRARARSSATSNWSRWPEQRQDVEHGIRLALEAMLVSPAFLYREEPQPEPDNAEKIQQIDEHSLATRLSYFLWSTMPDERLMDLADRGELRRRTSTARSTACSATPARGSSSRTSPANGCSLRDVATSLPARRDFPRFDSKLRDAMRRETEMLFDHVLRDDLPMATLLDADFTFLNERLARHYGIDGVNGDDFRKVSLADSRRHGILGHGSFHLLTSYPHPHLAGAAREVRAGEPARHRAAAAAAECPAARARRHAMATTAASASKWKSHREDPSCASCHALMDPDRLRPGELRRRPVPGATRRTASRSMPPAS